MHEEFENIVLRQHPMVYRLALSRLRCHADAEDVCQTVFLRLYRAAPVFDDSEHERAWLLRTTINCCKDLHRSAWRRHVVVGESGRKAAESVLADASIQSAGERVCAETLADSVADAMGKLSEKQRTAIHLFHFEQMTCDEIADVMGERPSTVRSHLRRGRAILQRELGDLL